jgi:hypothetical protein
LQSKKQSSAISDDDDSDVRPSKLFQRPNRTPSGLGDELSGLGTRDKKAAHGKHRVQNSSESDSDEADGSMKTPDCGIDNILALFQVLSQLGSLMYSFLTFTTFTSECDSQEQRKTANQCSQNDRQRKS